MNIVLLAISARGLFIAMLIIMIVVSLLFGFIIFMALRPVKKPPEAVDASNIRKLLIRRETQITVELMQTKDDEAKRSELLNKLRRVKSAEQLVDELVEEEKAIEGATEAEEAARAKKKGGEKKPAQKGKPVGAKRPPAPRPDREGEAAAAQDGEKPRPSAEKPRAPRPPRDANEPAKPAKPVKKKKDSNEFTPSFDD